MSMLKFFTLKEITNCEQHACAEQFDKLTVTLVEV
jgi:hypothetical protein